MMFDRLHTEPVYNTRAVVQRTGVPADTFRAWERRYNLPVPCRTLGNQRLYSERDVAIIAWLRDQTRAGMTISHAIGLFNSLAQRAQQAGELPAEDVGRFLNDGTAPSGDSSTSHVASFTRVEPRTSFFHTCIELINALTSFDATGAERILEEMMAIGSVETVCHEVLRPTMSEIRHRRTRQLLPGGVERFAHSFMQRKVTSLFNHSHPETGRGPILAAGVEGDHDELDLLYLSLFLSRGGFCVIYLGTDLACDEIEKAVETLHPPLVLLTASGIDCVDILQESIDRISHPTGNANAPFVGYTGDIFARQPVLRQRVNAPYFNNDGPHAVATCDRLLHSAQQRI